ncbi:MAG: hypothetical protein JWN37_224 [Candidatus Nomurabacteria bacterium]|nr:hypothetical protein [Candidatus Nomurabacteria bacterium]
MYSVGRKVQGGLLTWMWECGRFREKSTQEDAMNQYISEPGKPDESIELTSMGCLKDGSRSEIWSGSNGKFYKTDEHNGETTFWRSWYCIPKDDVAGYVEKLKQK